MTAANEVVETEYGASAELSPGQRDFIRTVVAAEIARSGRAAGTTLARRLATERPRHDAERTPARSDHERTDVLTDPVTADTAPMTTVPLEDLLADTRVGLADDVPVALWLPGAADHEVRFDAATIRALGTLAPPGTVFVIGAARDGQVLAGDRPVSAETLQATIAAKAPGMLPFLLIPGVAEPLVRQLVRQVDGPLLVAPDVVRFEPRTGLTFFRQTEAGPVPEPFLLYEPGLPDASPIETELRAAGDEHDSSAPMPTASDLPVEADDAAVPRSSLPRSPSVYSVRSDMTHPTIRGPHGDEVEETPPPIPSADAPVTEDQHIDEAARSIGIPRAGLPYMGPLLTAIGDALRVRGQSFTEKQKAELVQRLLSNYPYLLGSKANDNASGLVVPIGSSEVLITFDPQRPRRVVRNPGGSYVTPSEQAAPGVPFAAVDTINAAYGTGAHAETHSGQTGATRGKIAVTFGVGATPGVLEVVKVGASVSGTANQSNRSTTNIKDAERGKVEDSRTNAELVAYPEVNISFKIRRQDGSEQVPHWQHLPPTPVTESGEEALLVWVAKPYTQQAPKETVTATGATVETRKRRLPRNYHASGLTKIPQLFDEILTTLWGQGLRLPPGSVTRKELLQKLSNLNAHLDDAVNERRGYQITLHNARGRKIARVHVRSERLYRERTPQVGATSKKSHLEDVRTAIDGSSGSHTVTNSSTIMPLSAEFGLLPDPVGAEDAGLNLRAALSYTSSHTDTLSAGRTGLWVSVPRFTGHTAAYDVRFRHSATVSVLRGRRTARHRTDPVEGRGLVRMPVKEAFAHGFAVDRNALAKRPRKGVTTMPYRDDAVLGAGRRATDPEDKELPLHVQEGKGVGMGLVRVADGTVDALREAIEREVGRYGFLPRDQDDPFASHHWFSHGSRLRRRLDNQDLVKKMISTQGLDSHYDQIHQDGMTFTLRLSSGVAGVDLNLDSVKVTVKARKSTTTAPRFHRPTDEYHTVNLAMGMDTAGEGTSRSRKLAAGVSARGRYANLKGAATGIEVQASMGASDNVSFLNNRPELLEFPGAVDEFELTSDYEVNFEYKNSARAANRSSRQTGNRLRKSPQSQRSRQFRLPGQTAVVHLLPLGSAAQTGPVQEGRAPSDLLDQGLGYFVDTTGLRELAGRVLTELTGPARAADSDIDTFAGTIGVRAHLREILKGEYTTDRLFETGFFRDTFGALDISGELHDLRFSGSTGEKFVKGDIKLFLAENRLTDSDFIGLTWDQLDVAAGDDHAGHAKLSGGADASRHWQWNNAESTGRSGGKELIQLDFNHVYAYAGKMHLALSARQEKHSKLWPSGTPRHLTGEPLGPRTVMFLLSEPEALKRYAEGSVPISDAQLKDALTRWQDGKLTLSGDTVAKVLMRWKRGLTAEIDGREGLAVWENDQQEPLRQADAFADTLARMHRTGQEPVRDAQVREDFDTAFERPESLTTPRDPFDTVDTLGHPDLLAYADDEQDLSEEQLAEKMGEWRNGDLVLTGDTVAKILARWMTDRPPLPDEDERKALVQLLYDLHARGALPVRQPSVRERFEELLAKEQRPLPDPQVPIEHIELPEYLRREDPGGRILGHSGMQTYHHDNGKTTYQLVREKIEAVAPGMLAKGAEIWSRDGRVIGRTQGSVDALQAMLAKGRDVGMFEELLSTNGWSFYLVNPVGWLLTDIVEVNVSSVLRSAPKIGDFVPSTGIEVYSHGYDTTSTSKSADGSQSLSFAKFGSGGQQTTTASDTVAGKVAEGHHRGITRTEMGVTEQTVYDWSGHYLTAFDEDMTIKVRRLRTRGRLLNNPLLTMFDGLTHHGRTAQGTFPGRLEIQVPRSIAQAGVLRGPSARPDLAPLPDLPGNAFVAGTLLDDALPIARTMLAKVFEPGAVAKMFGAKAGDPTKQSSLSLPVVLSRLHLSNHLREAIGGRTYQVAKGVIMPGDASVRADLFLSGDLYDLEVIAPLKEGAGTGRYAKHQSGTNAFSSTDQVRAEANYQADASGQMGHHHADQPPHTWDGQNTGNRVTSMNQNSAGTENYRREQHAKEQGPLLMVRLRFRGRLHADKFEHHLIREPKFKGRFESDPISGDVYAELFEAEVGELRAQVERTRAEAQARTEPWPNLRGAASFDLAPLLAGAARNRLEPIRAYQEVARHIRTGTGGDRPVVLTADARALAEERYRAVLPWAVRTMRADLTALRLAGVPRDAPAVLQNYESRLDHLRRWEQGSTDRHPAMVGPYGGAVGPAELDQAVDRVISDVQAMRDRMNAALADTMMPGVSLGILPELPPEVAVLGLDPVYVARDVAHALDTHVLVEIRQADGVERRRWVDPGGGVHAFDPARNRIVDGRLRVFDGRGWASFTADLAHRHGLLSERHRADAIAFALGDAELGRLYLDSMARQQTFEQAVAAEITARRERVASLSADLPDRHRTDLATFALDDAELYRLHRDSNAGQTFAQAVAAEITARRERLETLSAGASERVRQAFEAQRFWRSDLEWRRVQEGLTRRALKPLGARIAGLQARLAGPSNAAEDSTARAEIDEALHRYRLQEELLTQMLHEVSVTQDDEKRLNDASEILTSLRASARPDASAPLSPEAVARMSERLTDLTSLGLQARTARVTFVSQPLPPGDTTATVESRLDRAGPGAVSLVYRQAEPGLLVAVNQDGVVRWFDPRSGRTVGRPDDASASLDLDLTGAPAEWAADLPDFGLDQEFFQRLRSSAVALAERGRPPSSHAPRPLRTGERLSPVPEEPTVREDSGPDGPVVAVATDEPAPLDPHLYRSGPHDYRVSESGLAQDAWRHVGALSDFAPLSWLARGGTARGLTASDVARDSAERQAAVRFFAHAERAPTRADAVRTYLAERSGRDVEVTQELPEHLPADTWVWFADRDGDTGATRIGDNGAMRTFASAGTTLRSTRRRLVAESRTFVIAWPSSHATVSRQATAGAPPVVSEPGAVGGLVSFTGQVSPVDAERLTAAFRGWSQEDTAGVLRRLEFQLEQAGPGALALVTTDEPEQRLLTLNRDGLIEWFEFPSLRKLARDGVGAAAARHGAYVALGPDGVLLNPPATPAALGEDPLSFPELYDNVVTRLRAPREAVMSRRPATGRRPGADEIRAFLETPRTPLPAAGPTMPDLAWVKSPHSVEEFCVEVAVIRP